MSTPSVTRRALLKVAAALPLPVIAGTAAFSGPLTPENRQKLVFELKRETALAEFTAPGDSRSNGDEQRYSDRRASFSKTMPYDALGEVEPQAYSLWLSILASGKSADFARAPRDPHAVERLNNPQASYAIDLIGADPTALPLAPAPAFASFAAASEMAELYWLALTLDVPFQSYGSHPLAQAAVADLRSIGFPNVSSATLFRGETSGDVRGPFVSQFLWRDIPFGLQTIEQRFPLPSRDQDFRPSRSATPTWLSGLKPPMPAPWPARGSMSI